MSCHTAMSVFFPWSAPHKAALWWQRHTKRPRGSLFLPVGWCRWPVSIASAQPSGERHAERYSWRCLHLLQIARPFGRSVRRRGLPPAIPTREQQTGRERPRPRNALAFQAPSNGVAHALSAGVGAVRPAVTQPCILPPRTGIWSGAARGAAVGSVKQPHERITYEELSCR